MSLGKVDLTDLASSCGPSGGGQGMAPSAQTGEATRNLKKLKKILTRQRRAGKGNQSRRPSQKLSLREGRQACQPVHDEEDLQSRKLERPWHRPGDASLWQVQSIRALTNIFNMSILNKEQEAGQAPEEKFNHLHIFFRPSP